MKATSEPQQKTTYKLCENTDCERYPDDEDFDNDANSIEEASAYH